MSTSQFMVGDFVRVRKNVTRLRLYQGQRGEVVRVNASAVTVRFLEHPRSEESSLRFIRITLKSSELVMEGNR
jgi:hypothetical protein